MKIDENIGKIYGCYKILKIGEPSILPSGQKKKNYICECIKCKNVRNLNAYKVTHNNYQYCNNCKPYQRSVRIPLIGNRFGRLTVIQRVDNYIQPNGKTKVMYKCICDCGNEVIVSATHLMSKHTQSCGCLHIKILQDLFVKDLTGQQFGKLTVIDKNEVKNGRQYWNCKCECGNITVASSSTLIIGKKKSCGCLKSIAEYEFAAYLDNQNYKYEQQFTFEDCKDKRKLPFDFGIKDEHEQLLMLVELHGQQHYYPFTYCNEPEDIKNKNYIERKRKDLIKEDYCKKNNIPLLVIKYNNFDRKEYIFEKFYTSILKKEIDHG